MLAYNGLALITEKLQNQRLEEPAGGAAQQQQQQQQQQAVTVSSVYGSGSNSGNMGASGIASRLPQMTTETAAAKDPCAQQSNLAVKGKNVWAPPLELEHQDRPDCSLPEVKTHLRFPDKGHILSFQTATCRHRKLRHQCPFCDITPGTPSAPPKKKHCRSLSVPPDNLSAPGKEIGGGVGRARIWRPIAVIPLGSSPKQQDEDLSLVRDRDSTTVHPSFLEPPTRWLSHLNTDVPSPPSVDSGHYTTSDLQTPPGSPVPQRPASAASDSSCLSSRGSYSSSSAWQEYSPLRTSASAGGARARVLETRSLSLEDRISGASSTTSIPCLHCRSSSSNDEITGEGRQGDGRIPRCHSQPCVLHHRRCGKKRRRDCDRPTLNFNKMTETAYSRSHRRSEPWNTSVVEHQLWPPGPVMAITPSSSRMACHLNTIASSPLDSTSSDLLAGAHSSRDLSQVANIALPLTPPHHRSPTSFLDARRKMEEEDEDEEEDDEEETDNTDCSCHEGPADHELFPLADLDLEEIENH